MSAYLVSLESPYTRLTINIGDHSLTRNPGARQVAYSCTENWKKINEMWRQPTIRYVDCKRNTFEWQRRADILKSQKFSPTLAVDNTIRYCAANQGAQLIKVDTDNLQMYRSRKQPLTCVNLFLRTSIYFCGWRETAFLRPRNVQFKFNGKSIVRKMKLPLIAVFYGKKPPITLFTL